MTKDPLLYIDDMLQSIEVIEEHVEGHDLESFQQNILTQDAVIRRFTIIGEACRRVPVPFKESHPEMPWAKINAMRNFVVHEYDKVVLPTIWKTIKNDLPSLKALLKAIT